ncbi:MAG: phage holin family protein [Cyanobacteria bacterium P01_C01_bin.73]
MGLTLLPTGHPFREVQNGGSFWSMGSGESDISPGTLYRSSQIAERTQYRWSRFIDILLLPILILVNALLFGLTAKLVSGFRLKSFWSAILGAIALSIVNRLLLWILTQVGLGS